MKSDSSGGHPLLSGFAFISISALLAGISLQRFSKHFFALDCAEPPRPREGRDALDGAEGHALMFRACACANPHKKSASIHSLAARTSFLASFPRASSGASKYALAAATAKPKPARHVRKTLFADTGCFMPSLAFIFFLLIAFLRAVHEGGLFVALTVRL
jgi:hypothetical protein